MPLRIASEKQGVVWNGSYFVTHSLALVNRELTLALLENETFRARFDLGIQHYEPPAFAPDAEPRFLPLAARMKALPETPRLTIRHRWPPDFSRPQSGHLVLIQPWEFGSLPRVWVDSIAQAVDEVWVPSHFVRESYMQSGVPAEKVVVVPNGVNTARFHPGVEPCDFARNPLTRHLKSDTYKFLFVGGTIPRKGVDALLDAYDRTFTAQDNVTLIIKDFGTGSFYANQGAGALIRALQAKPGGANIVYLTEDMSEAELAALYAGCDCLVHPYRGEGYGLPIAEAMACGKPTILTGSGAARDFADESNAYLIPASRHYFPERRLGEWETVETPFLLEPDRAALSLLLKRVLTKRDEAAAKGAKAAADIAERHTWAHAAQIALARLLDLSERRDEPARRLGLPTLARAAALSTYEERKQAALTQTRDGNWMRAVALLETCLLERSDDWDMLNALAVARFRTGAMEKALELLRQGIAQSPNPRDFYHNLAFIQLESGKPGEALENALRALEATPDNADIRRTVERAREGILKRARQILRGVSDSKRAQAKRDPEYRALMAQYQEAGEALEGKRAKNASEANTPETTVEAVKPRLSLCMIVRNEERFLRNCLESVRGLVDEMVLVDTGSTDRTMEIAREFGAVVVQHEWKDDFSEARNISLLHATGNWVLWLDADEELAPESRAHLRSVVENAPTEIGAYLLMFRNWLTFASRQEGSEVAVHHACRLFRRLPGVHFQGRIHEQNLPSLRALGYTFADAGDLIIDHFGYAGEIMTLRNKHERFIRMLEREVAECPAEEFRVFHLFNLGNAYFTAGNMEKAAEFLAKAAEEPDITEEFTSSIFTELATALHRLGRAKEGLEACARADALGVRHPGVEFARGYCLLHLERYTEAEQAFRKALRMGQENLGVFGKTGDVGAGGFKSQYGLALALVGQDRYAEALPCCEAALEEKAKFVDARYLLSIVLTRLDRLPEAREALETVVEHNPNHTEGWRDLGVALHQLQEYAQALPLLRQLVSQQPESFDLRGRLASTCEELGLLDEAQEHYRYLRRLKPNSAEICVNLGRVLAAAGIDAEAIDCFADAIALNPNYGNAYFNAGDLLYRLGYYDRASETYLSGLEVEPERPAGFFMLGNCYFQSGAYAAAVACYREALKQAPDYADAQHNLAMAEERAAQNPLPALQDAA